MRATRNGILRPLAATSAVLPAVLIALGFSATSPAQNLPGSAEASRVTQTVDNSLRSPIAATHLPLLDKMQSTGAVSASTPMGHMQLLLRPSAARTAALTSLINAQHDPKSPNFHQWVTPEEFGQSYGVADGDIEAVKSWLVSEGFTINGVYPNKLQIDFSGTAGLVKQAFLTAEKLYTIDNVTHRANASDISVPLALRDVVTGVAGLTDIHPQPQHKAVDIAQLDADTQKFKVLKTVAASNALGQPQAVTTPGVRGLVPYDMAKIYGVDKLHNAGITGRGITIAVVEDDSMNPSDWQNFVQEFSLAKYGGTFSQITPQATGFTNCISTIPNGPTDDATETLLDAEWSTAIAPSAQVEEASCSDADGTDSFGGVFVAAFNLINGSSRPNVISASYGLSESRVDPASKTAIDLMWAQADAEGISVFVAAGDSGSNVDFNGFVIQGAGISANALATSGNVTAVGGTDLADVLDHTTATYFSNKLNAEYGSALSYVPEITWNESCGNTVAAKYFGFSSALDFCRAQAASDPDLVLLTSESGSGGPSVIDAKPAWQRLVYNAAKDQSRDIPDVSLFAGSYGQYTEVVICTEFHPCSPGFITPAALSGGTSLASPMFASIQALIDQGLADKGLRPNQGNAPPTLYALASEEYGSASTRPPATLAGCQAGNGTVGTQQCVFHDITLGGNSTNCESATITETGGAPFTISTPDCYVYQTVTLADNFSSGTFNAGLTSTSTTQYNPNTAAFAARPGWDFANGLGSVNAQNLLTAWKAFVDAP